jgi:uncharacterized protein
MTAKPKRKLRGLGRAEADRLNGSLLQAAYDFDNDAAVGALKDGADVATVHEQTGLTALHIAAGTNNLALARILVEDWDAPFGPDRYGRWPTVIAAECRAGKALCDYIVEQEALFLEQEEQAPAGGTKKR